MTDAQIDGPPVAKTSPSYAKLAAALAKAQGVMGGAKKDSTNPHLKSKYADLASVWEACRGPLSANDLAIVQFPEASGATVTVRTMLLHSSGEYLETSISATGKDSTPQTIGSVITYLRRYSLAAMVGIAPEDDDGQSAQPGAPASNQTAKSTAQTPKPAAPTAPATPSPDWSKLAADCAGEMKRRGVAQGVLLDWRKSMGYPEDGGAMTAEQLEEMLQFIQTFPLNQTA